MKNSIFAPLWKGVYISMAVAWCVHADEFPEEPAVLKSDLNGDGVPEQISRRRLGADDQLGTFYQILVKDARGKLLWSSPEVLDADHALAFGEWHFGISLPQFAGDIDQDGAMELIVPAPQSDVSPTFFRVLRWTGQSFVPRQSKALTGKARKGAAFRWTDQPSLEDFWVEKWIGASAEGGWVVKLVSLAGDDEGEHVLTAVAVLVTRGDGFELARWIDPPQQVGGDTVVEPVEEAQPGSYRARLSARDHVNSKGVPLTKVIDVLRQDRANVHLRRQRDPEDQVEAVFRKVQDREAMERMPLRVAGGPGAETAILTGEPVVEVRFSGGSLEVRIIKP